MHFCLQIRTEHLHVRSDFPSLTCTFTPWKITKNGDIPSHVILSCVYIKQAISGVHIHHFFSIDLSNGVGVGVGFGIGLGLRNISEGCFKTTKVNKYKIRKVNRAMLGYGI